MVVECSLQIFSDENWTKVERFCEIKIVLGTKLSYLIREVVDTIALCCTDGKCIILLIYFKS